MVKLLLSHPLCTVFDFFCFVIFFVLGAAARFVDDAKTKKCILPCTPLAVVKIMEHVGVYDESLPVGNRLQGEPGKLAATWLHISQDHGMKSISCSEMPFLTLASMGIDELWTVQSINPARRHPRHSLEWSYCRMRLLAPLTVQKLTKGACNMQCSWKAWV